MDLRHFDHEHAAEVTRELAEDRPGKNKLYRVEGRVYKATSHWLDDLAALPGQRRVEVTVSLCDEQGQAIKGPDGSITVSEPHVLVVSAGLPRTPAEQVDQGTRRVVVAFHHVNAFWGHKVRGVAKRRKPAARKTA